MGKRGFLQKKLGKRGLNFLIMELFQLSAAMLVMVIELSTIGGIGKGLTITKDFYARDIALMVDLMYASPSNLNYLYAIKSAEGELFNINSSKFFVEVSGKNYPRAESYEFYANSGMQMLSMNVKEFAGFLRFSKEGPMLSASSEGKGNSAAINCPSIKTSLSGWKGTKVAIDAAHGGDDRGFINSKEENFYEAERTRTIAMTLGNTPYLTNHVFTRETGGMADGERLEKAREGGIAISIHAGSSADINENFVKAYFNGGSDKEIREKSAKLGCMIINSILSNEKIKGINGASIVPSYLPVIPKDRVGVMLELGNIQIPRNDNFLSKESEIAKSIYSGVEGYFG